MERLLSKSRLSRARAIPQTAVVEFVKIQDDPLVAYALIQGSEREPYIAIIDLQDKIVAHWCPDFAGGGERNYGGYGRGYGGYGGYGSGGSTDGGWCKHLGKLLLLLPAEDTTRIANVAHALGKKTSQAAVKKMLEQIKERMVTSGKNRNDTIQNEIPLVDRIDVACKRTVKGDDCGELFGQINEQLDRELSASSPSLSLHHMSVLLDKVPSESLETFAKRTRDVFKKHVDRSVAEFRGRFWITSIIKRLETAALLKTIGNKLDLDISLAGLERPTTLTTGEMQDARAVLQLLMEKEPKRLKDTVTALHLPREIARSHVERVSRAIMISGTLVDEVKRWVESQLKAVPYTLPSASYTDDLLIYIMSVAGEKPEVHLTEGSTWHGIRDFYYLSEKQMEGKPAFKYVIDHVKESAREYVTKRELQAHNKLFKWLAGATTPCNWIERPRPREADASFPGTGVLVQWDINACKPYQEFLQAFDGSTRIVFDQTSPVATKIQPFDIVLCRKDLMERPGHVKVAHPLFILVPEQAINLVTRGMPIISNVIPWHVLSDYSCKGYLSGARVSLAIEQCKNTKFVYGSVDLLHTLEGLSRLGKSGMQDAAFATLKKEITVTTNRLNPTTRKVVHDALSMEGHVAGRLLGLVTMAEEERQKLVLNLLRSATSPDEFRKLLTDSIFRMLVKDGSITTAVFDFLKTEKLGAYGFAPAMLSAHLKEEFSKLTKLIRQRNAITWERLTKNQVGKMLASSLGLSSANAITPDIQEMLIRKTGELIAALGT